jgi:hypothetical protein
MHYKTHENQSFCVFTNHCDANKHMRRFDAEGNLVRLLPMEFDELDCDLDTLTQEQKHEKLWQYATDGKYVHHSRSEN